MEDKDRPHMSPPSYRKARAWPLVLIVILAVFGLVFWKQWISRRRVPFPQTQCGNPIDVPLYLKEGFNSCWAACAEIVMQYIGKIRVRQCDQAKEASPNAVQDCCDASSGDLKSGAPCDELGYPDFAAWKFSAIDTPTPLTWQECVDEIKACRPFTYSRIDNSNDSEHMVVVDGYQTVQSEQQLRIVDPQGAVAHVSWIPYSDYKGSPGFTHVTTYWHIAKSP